MAMEFVKGVYFNPTDQDLLHYLHVKVSSDQGGIPHFVPIRDQELYQDKVPSDLFVGDFAESKELFFFTTLKNKFQNGNADRKDRVVGNGTWTSQRTRDVLDGRHLLGFKTMLNFFENGTKTGSKWIMHEYTLPPAAKQQGWAVCRIKKSSRNPKSADSSSPASSSSSPASSSGPVKRKATPLDHHHRNKRPHFSHPQSQVPPTTQSPLTPPHIAASPLDDHHSDQTVSHDTPEAAAATPDDDDAEYVRLLENELTIEEPPDDDDELARFLDTTLTMDEDDFLDSDVAALHPEKEVIIIEDELDSDASALHPDIVASPLDDDHSKGVCHDTPEATPDDDNAEYVHFPENELIIVEDDLDSDASALHPDIAASPLDDDHHSKRVCHDTPEAPAATPHDDGNAEFLHFVQTQLTMEMVDYLDSNVSALTAQHLEPATAHHQHMIPPADYHAAAILDPPQATATTTHGEFGETEYLLAEFPNYNFCSDQQNPKKNSTSAADSDDEGSGKRLFLSTTNDGEREPMGWNERVQQ